MAGTVGDGLEQVEPRAVAQIITSCARLPLALSIVAARAAAHPAFPLEALADELCDVRRSGLDVFEGGDQATSVRSVFSWSYGQLSAPVRRLFRLPGLHPGPDIAPPAAASLAALPTGQARSALAELARAHLVTEYVPGRFAFHDLLRAYAVELADHHDTKADRQAAAHRMLDHYLQTAHTAASSLHPRWEPARLPPLQPGVTPEECDGYQAASAWFEAERPVMLAVIQLAAATGRATHAWQLSWTLMDYLDRRGHWDDLTAIQEAALKAARNRADRQGEAHAHEGLGISYRWLGRYGEAEIHLQEALKLFDELGDRVSQADVHSGLIWLRQYEGDPEAGLQQAELALALYRAAGHRAGEANALSDIAWSRTLLHDDHQAMADCEQALTLFRERGDRRGEAHTLDTLGHALKHLGDHAAAARCYQRSLDLHIELGDRYHQAAVLDHLGNTRYAAGQASAACAAWQRALDILGRIPIRGPSPDYYPDADKIGVKLLQLRSPSPAPEILNRGRALHSPPAPLMEISVTRRSELGRPAFSGQRNWSYFMLHADRATPARSLRWPGGQLGDRPVLGLKTLPMCSHYRRQQAQDRVAGMQDQRLAADVPVVRVHAAPAAGRKSGTKSRGGSPWAMTASRATQGRVTR